MSTTSSHWLPSSPAIAAKSILNYVTWKTPRFLKRTVKRAATDLWLKNGAVRRCPLGCFRGIRFHVSPMLLGRLVVLFSAYEPEVTAYLSSSVRPGMVVYDVGSHIGVHALYAAKLLDGNGVVYAFEPWPDNFAELRNNLSSNPSLSPRVRPVNKAVGATCGTVSMEAGPTDGTHHVSQDGAPSHIDVRMITLDCFSREGGETPSILKIDVEGLEMDVLLGAESLIRKVHPTLIIEHHGTAACAMLTAWLEDRGYEVRPLGTRHFVAEFSCETATPRN